jgi:hypothetical protein
MNKQPLYIKKYMLIILKQICYKIKLNLTLFLNILVAKRARCVIDILYCASYFLTYANI